MDKLCKIENGTLFVKVEGELDHCMAEQIRGILDKNLVSPGVNRIIFDLSKLTFMDSTGIGLLIGRYKRARALNVDMYITGATAAVSKILNLSGIFSIIPTINI